MRPISITFVSLLEELTHKFPLILLPLWSGISHSTCYKLLYPVLLHWSCLIFPRQTGLILFDLKQYSFLPIFLGIACVVLPGKARDCLWHLTDLSVTWERVNWQ